MGCGSDSDRNSKAGPLRSSGCILLVCNGNYESDARAVRLLCADAWALHRLSLDSMTFLATAAAWTPRTGKGEAGR